MRRGQKLTTALSWQSPWPYVLYYTCTDLQTYYIHYIMLILLYYIYVHIIIIIIMYGECSSGGGPFASRVLLKNSGVNLCTYIILQYCTIIKRLYRGRDTIYTKAEETVGFTSEPATST